MAGMSGKGRVAARRPSLLRLIPRHGAFPVSAGIGIVAFLLTLLFDASLAIGLGAIAMFATYLALVLHEVPAMTPQFLRRHADEADAPVLVIALVTVFVVIVACVSLFIAINGEEQPPPAEVAIGMLSVLLGWFVVHTMAAIHYAYEYYESADANPDGARHRLGEDAIVGGLDWGDGDAPDGRAFIYLAYTIGTAVQMADVRTTSNAMRLLIMVHAVFAFFFNTVIVAASVNIVVTAFGG